MARMDLEISFKALQDGGRTEYEMFKEKYRTFSKMQYLYAIARAGGMGSIEAYRAAGGTASNEAAAAAALAQVPRMSEAIQYMAGRRRSVYLDKLEIMEMYLNLYNTTKEDTVKRAVLSDLSKITGIFAPKKLDIADISTSDRLQEARKRYAKYAENAGK